MAGFLFLRARGHRLLLAAALLAILLTTSVLAALAAFAGSVSDAGLRHALQTRDASAAALVITTENSELDRVAAARDAQRGARLAFDGLPVTLRTFERSGPYALPRALQSPAARKGEPDLTLFAAVDRSHVRLSAGAWPAPGTGKVIPVALPEAAAKQLKLAPGPRVLTVTDRMGGPPVRIKVTGTYRPLDRSASYWQLDELNGRGSRRTSSPRTVRCSSTPTASLRAVSAPVGWPGSPRPTSADWARSGSTICAAPRGRVSNCCPPNPR